MAKQTSMTRKQMRDQIQKLLLENEILRTNPNYGTLTRQALEIEHRKLVGEDELYVIMIDVDHLHDLNKRYGSQEPVNQMIRRAFDFRHDDLLLKGNYASGDEIAFIVRADPVLFMNRLRESLAREGITATMAYTNIIDDDLLGACERAIHLVYALKKMRGEKSR